MSASAGFRIWGLGAQISLEMLIGSQLFLPCCRNRLGGPSLRPLLPRTTTRPTVYPEDDPYSHCDHYRRCTVMSIHQLLLHVLSVPRSARRCINSHLQNCASWPLVSTGRRLNAAGFRAWDFSTFEIKGLGFGV